ncbi:hypothetical protein [Streptomyces sp. 11x1]|uniref:hypothetical protein n=1 Tax=Streptomyces sp. 11x1 TaxID=3038642 RepID=UPI00292F9EE0|nr:hypothetical protein [Streptomyces sp. 11x1]WNZ11677.1 hypothetical protein P8T65_31745 [Streptomyces sp. 11x1]
MTYTATADNAPMITGTTRMTVGGPALSAPGQETGVSGLASGKLAQVTPRLANNTRFPAAHGVALQVNVSDGLTLTTRYSNCFYVGPSPTSAWCTQWAPRRTAITAADRVPLRHHGAAGHSGKPGSRDSCASVRDSAARGFSPRP